MPAGRTHSAPMISHPSSNTILHAQSYRRAPLSQPMTRNVPYAVHCATQRMAKLPRPSIVMSAPEKEESPPRWSLCPSCWPQDGSHLQLGSTPQCKQLCLAGTPWVVALSNCLTTALLLMPPIHTKVRQKGPSSSHQNAHRLGNTGNSAGTDPPFHTARCPWLAQTCHLTATAPHVAENVEEASKCTDRLFSCQTLTVHTKPVSSIIQILTFLAPPM